MECPSREENLSGCTCTHPTCTFKGICCLCISYHRERGELPGCLFPPEVEPTYDRSVRCFIEAHSARAKDR